MAEQKPQTFANHTRWDALFHFFLIPVFALGLVMAIVHLIAHLKESDFRDNFHAAMLILLATAFLIWISKTRLYALKVRDPPGGTVAAHAAVARGFALAHSRVDRKPTVRAAFRFRR